MGKLLAYEINALKAYLELPSCKLLDHRFEMEEDYLAGYVSRFIKGERFDKEFVAFTKDMLEVINPIISKSIHIAEGKDLLSAFLLTKVTCNIMNKYKNYTNGRND